MKEIQDKQKTINTKAARFNVHGKVKIFSKSSLYVFNQESRVRKAFIWI